LGEDVIRFWRSTHVGLAAIGVWSIATGAALSHLVLGIRSASVLSWSVILSNYAIFASILVRALAQALDFDVSGVPYRQIVAGGRNASAITGFVAAILTLRGAAAAVRVAKSDASASSTMALGRAGA
jgi:hypothetical protein